MNLLEHSACRRDAQTRTAVFLGELDAGKPERRQLGHAGREARGRGVDGGGRGRVLQLREEWIVEIGGVERVVAVDGQPPLARLPASAQDRESHAATPVFAMGTMMGAFWRPDQ